jgi:hypothetical protein
MLERLSKKTQFCFLDGYSGFSQIAVKKQDQEKITFTYHYGTYAYRRMPFGLCNAPATFQRWMSTIFHGFCEEIVEVFMDDLSVYGTSFDNFLHNLDKVLHRCEETNLVLNCEKCHFMVNEGIVLGHKICKRGIEVDRAKVKELRKCPILGMLKVFVVFFVMLGFLGGLLKISLRFQSLLLIFFKKMYHLFLMMIVRKLLKLLRRL